MSFCKPCHSGNNIQPQFPGFPPPRGSSSGNSSSSSSGSGSTDGTTGATCPDGTTLPVVAAQFTVPAIGAVGQFSSLCASSWAITGNAIQIAPFGNLQITGVSGDVISYENLSIPANTTISAGQRLFSFIPVSTQAGTPGSQLDQIQGTLGGALTLMGGSPFQTLRWQPVGSNTYLQNISGFLQFYPSGATPTEIQDSVDPNLTNPILTAVASVTANYNLPSLPSVLPPSFYVQLVINLRAPTAAGVYNNGFYVEQGGFEIARLQYIGTTTYALVRASSNTLQLQFRKPAGTANCSAIVYVAGYFA